MVKIEEFRHGMGLMAKINKSHLFLLPKHQEQIELKTFDSSHFQLNLSHNCKSVGEPTARNNWQASGAFSISIHPKEAARR